MRWLIIILLIFPFLIPQTSTITVSAGGDLQAALNSVQCGGAISIQAGATFTGNFTWSKNCAANPVTVQTSNLAGISAPNVRLNPASQAGAMPKIRSTNGQHPFRTTTGASGLKLIGIEITTDGSVYTPDLVGVGPSKDKPTQEEILQTANITIDRCFIHPAELSATNLFPTTLNRTSGRGIGITGRDIWVVNSYIAGFAGKYPTNHSEAGHNIDSYGIYSVVGPGPIHILNNYVEAQFNNVFLGGGDPNTPNTATITNPTLTSATFSNVPNLVIGDLVALRSTGATPKPWQSARVTGISGNVVSYAIIHPRDSSPVQVPDNNGMARWRGFTVVDTEIRGNFLNKPDAWNTFSEPKAWIEVKIADRTVIDGNDMYSGVGTTIALTVRNQDGSAPWSNITNNSFTNNRMRGYKWGFGVQASDNEQPSGAVENWLIANNLFEKQLRIEGSQPYFIQFISGVTSGANNIKIVHNTILQEGSMLLTDVFPVTGITYQNNIVGSGRYGPTCFMGSLSTCWPGLAQGSNVIWDNREDQNSSFPLPGNSLVKTVDAIGFVDAANGNYALAATSAFKGKGSDGKDPGVDMNVLLAALGGAAPQPTPSSTPTPQSTPSASPSPPATPTPLPTASPTPIATPTVSPTPLMPRVIGRQMSSDAGTRVNEINDFETKQGVKLIHCDGRFCYFARRP